MGNSGSSTAKRRASLTAILNADLPEPPDDSDTQHAELKSRLGLLPDGGLPSLAVIRHVLNARAGDFGLFEGKLHEVSDSNDRIARTDFVSGINDLLHDVEREAVHLDLLGLIFDALARSTKDDAPESEEGSESAATITVTEGITVMALFAHKDDADAAASSIFTLADKDLSGALDMEEATSFAAIQMRVRNLILGDDVSDTEKDLHAAKIKEVATKIFEEMSAGAADGVVNEEVWKQWFHEHIVNAPLSTPPFEDMRDIMNFGEGQFSVIVSAIEDKCEMIEEHSSITKENFVATLTENISPIEGAFFWFLLVQQRKRESREATLRRHFFLSSSGNSAHCHFSSLSLSLSLSLSDRICALASDPSFSEEWTQTRIAGLIYDIGFQYSPKEIEGIGLIQEDMCALLSLLCHPTDASAASNVVWELLDIEGHGSVAIDDILEETFLKAMLRLKRNGDVVSTDDFLEDEMDKMLGKHTSNSSLTKIQFAAFFTHVIQRKEPKLPGEKPPPLADMRAIFNIAVGGFEQMEESLVNAASSNNGNVSSKAFVDTLTKAATANDQESLVNEQWGKDHLAAYICERIENPNTKSVVLLKALCAMSVITHPDDAALAADALFEYIDVDESGGIDLDEVGTFISLLCRLMGLDSAEGATVKGALDAADKYVLNSPIFDSLLRVMFSVTRNS